MKLKIKIYIFITLLTACFISPAFAQEVGEVTIRGNDTVPAKDIKGNIEMDKGMEYSARIAAKDISSIYDMGKFNDVSFLLEEISTGVVRVVYKVEEKPVISRIEFKGNEKIKSKKLKKKIELEKGGFFDSFLLKEAEKKLKDYYLEEGFAEVEVESYSSEDEEKNSVTVTFFVNEGEKIEIEGISFVGVVGESYKKVLKQLETKEGKVYKQNQLKDDLEKVRQYYRNRGYLNVEVRDPLITFDPENRNMFITVFVDEGRKFYIGGIDFQGNYQIGTGALSKAVDIDTSDVYSEEKLDTAMSSIQEAYGKQGYIRMSVTPHYNYNNRDSKVDVVFDISEGPKVYVRNIYIDGNYITRDYVIEREFKLKEGEPFNLEKVRQTQAEIFKLGFFKDVRVDMLPAGSPDMTDLVFTVEEQKTGMASVGAGYSSVDKLVGTVRVSQDNLFGRGQQLAAMWEFGTGDTKKQNYRIDFTEPYLFNTPTPFSVSVYNTSRRRYYSDHSYREQRRGGSLALGRHFTDEITSFLKYSVEQIGIDDISAAIRDQVDESKETTSSITPSVSYDSRDYPFNPRHGMYLSLSDQIAGGIFGGDRDFVKQETKSTYFQPLIWRFTGVLNLDTGMVREYGKSTDVPIYERFYVGGGESVRGYDYWEIGPPEGGNYKLVTNLEIKFPIVSEKKQTILQGAFFYDIGSSWKEFDQITLKAGLEENKLKRGYGFGIRFKTRAFPIRLDYGYGVDKVPGAWEWYFSLGDIF